MGSKRTDNIKDLIVQNARKLIGTPFRNSGRSTLGIDCAGLLYLAFNRANIPFPSKSPEGSYTVAWWKHTDAEERLYNLLLSAGFRFLSDDELIDKVDIVCFKLYGDKYPAHHCGIMVDQFNFIHAKCGWKSNENKVGFDSLYPSYFKRLAKVMRHKEF